MNPSARLVSLLLLAGLSAPASALAVPPLNAPGSAAPISTPLILTQGAQLNVPVDFNVAASGLDYPPRDFPAFYPATSLPAGELDLRVYNTQAGMQSLQLTALPFAGGLRLDQLEYRVNEGPWLRASVRQNVMLLGTQGWQTYQVQFRLRLEGSEPAGQYQTSLIWQLGSASE